jgi:hypothetical protein
MPSPLHQFGLYPGLAHFQKRILPRHVGVRELQFALAHCTMCQVIFAINNLTMQHFNALQ